MHRINDEMFYKKSNKVHKINDKLEIDSKIKTSNK